MSRATDVTVMVLGSGNVGKSSLIKRVLGRETDDRYDPTIEDYFVIDKEINGVSYSVGIIDTSGQQEYSALIDNMIASADAVMLVFDVTREETLTELDSFYKRVKRLLLSTRPKVPLAVVANKIDLLEASERHIISLAISYAKEIKALAFTTSVRANEGVHQAFDSLLTEAVKHVDRQSSEKCCAVL